MEGVASPPISVATFRSTVIGMGPRRIWQAAQGELQLQLTRATYETWVRDSYGLSYEDGTLVVAVENPYAKDWLENRLLGTIKRTLAGILGRTVELRFTVRPKGTPAASPLLEAKPATRPFLSPRYTFDNFIVGNSNRLAHAAALAVAQRPAQAYNPLFLHGGVGLGKTHLLHAVGHLPANKGLQVLYVSSEAFTNDLINSIRNGTSEDFRAKYRSLDVLLIDDIQFIAGKEGTQEEFFHTFNALHSQNKQVVISSDRPPKAIPTLEERLRSRFEWGLIADIQPPDLETRVAILRSKAESQPLPVPTEVIDYLAHKIQSNIRELEGALNRLVAYAQMISAAVTLDTAATALKEMSPPSDPPSLQAILTAVAAYYGLELSDLESPRRAKSLAFPRQVAMFLARNETRASLVEIGAALGGRDHTTVLYGYEKISSLSESDPVLRRNILAIKELLYQTPT